jgi:LuxR family quorum-sensing system transcriptional regulator SolR
MPQSPYPCYADLLSGISSERQLFRKIDGLADKLGVLGCAYCIRMPLPLSRPCCASYSSYPPAWRRSAPYQEALHSGAEAWAHMTADALRGLVSLPEYRFHPCGSDALLLERAWGWRDARGVVALLTFTSPAGRDEAALLTPLARAAHAAMADLLVGRLMPEALARLTPRERQVLVWTAEGKSVPEISCILGISESTANFHVRNLIAKLRASNRAHAAVKAAVLGMI